ncbi:hypothetical protein SLEP1_g54070 [Rubroshorea leprosula]|uniref:Uncharacterized protein n=1 Tax=Rubroshorea leprosula TaxID=152421 RepID=A0AAV5MBJ5_9ROSI|nr:hypothetical protein SLEP1_g54070 [Rubroshorea leprosula]
MLAHVDMYFYRTGLSCQWDNTLVITDTCQWELLNTSTIIDACQWEFVKH